MALSGTGREEWPPGLVTSSLNPTEVFSPAWTLCATRLPAASSSAARALVQGELGVDQLALGLWPARGAVDLAAAFLAAGRAPS